MTKTPEEIEHLKAANAWKRKSEQWNGYTINHPLFGALTWSTYFWTGRLFWPMFDIECELLISDDEEADFTEKWKGNEEIEPPPGPGDWSVGLWAKFNRDWPSLRKVELIDALHTVLPDVLKVWLQHMSGEEFESYGRDVIMHAVSRERFEETLRAEHLGLHHSSGVQGICGVSVGFATEFDEEHGLEAYYFEDNRPLHVHFG